MKFRLAVKSKKNGNGKAINLVNKACFILFLRKNSMISLRLINKKEK